jgi:hypothetical protein
MEPGRERVESDKRPFIVSIKIMIILSVKWLTHFSRFAPLKVRYLSQEGNMAPKPKSKPARFVFAVAMALTILAVMTWEMAAPSSLIYPIYQPQLLLLY